MIVDNGPIIKLLSPWRWMFLVSAVKKSFWLDLPWGWYGCSSPPSCYLSSPWTSRSTQKGLLFPGFGPMRALHWKLVFPIKWGHEGAQNGALSVEKFRARALKMELFSWKILSTPGSWRHLMGRICAPAFAQTWPKWAQTPGIANLP